MIITSPALRYKLECSIYYNVLYYYSLSLFFSEETYFIYKNLFLFTKIYWFILIILVDIEICSYFIYTYIHTYIYIYIYIYIWKHCCCLVYIITFCNCKEKKTLMAFTYANHCLLCIIKKQSFA